LEKLYVLDMERYCAGGGGELVRQMRAAVGRAKRSASGETRLEGIALDNRGDRLLFRFRLGKK